jgi:two-component system chemotaxis response regulator CheB
VLVVDDSAFVRKTLGTILESSELLSVVGFAGDGQEALEQVRRLQPDVVTVDLEMPIMNGVDFIEAQMREAPLPIVVVSAVDPGGHLAASSMKAGAVEFVLKPTHLADRRLAEIQADLLDKVHAVASIPPRLLLSQEAVASSPALVPSGPVEAVVIGLSTGGPQLLHQILPRLPADFSLPLAVVIHMPAGFTGPLAERLDQSSGLQVVEARAALAMRPGRCIVGRAGQHLRLQPGTAGKVVAQLSVEPFSSPHRPSVDVLFRSASECYGSGLLALVLTGMGQDGLEGAAWVKANGGRVLTQTESSSTVWGMPRAVWESGLSDGQLSPAEIAPLLRRIATASSG